MYEAFDELPASMAPEQLADATGEHVASVRRGIREGRIPADMVNGRWRIYRDLVFKNTMKGVKQDEQDEQQSCGD